MPPVIYYYHPTSQPSRAILAFMHLTDIQYEKNTVDIFNCKHRTAEFKQINPLGTIPTIIDGDFIVWESEAIIKYLMNTRKVGEMYYPSDPVERVLVDKYLPYHHSVFRPNISKYFTSTYSYLKPYSHVTTTTEEIRPQVTAAIEEFERVFLQGKKYIGGDVLTIADLLAVNELTQLYFATDFNFDKVALAKAYVERCLENSVIREVQKDIKEFPEVVKNLPKAKL